MNPHEFNKIFAGLVRDERRATNEILKMISEFSETRGFLHLAYGSVFDWLVKGHGYSESAAYRRIEAARLIKAVPEVSAQLESGQVNLTQIAKVQSTIRAQEKAAKQRVPMAGKSAAVKAVAGKSKLQTEQTLLNMFPAAQREISQDRKIAVNEEFIRLSFNVPKSVMDDLSRARDILSHALPEGAYGDVLARLLKEFLDRRDPLRHKPKRKGEMASHVQ